MQLKAIILALSFLFVAPMANASTPRLNIAWKPLFSDTDQDFTNSGKRDEVELKFACELAKVEDNRVELAAALDKLASFYAGKNRISEAEDNYYKAIECLKSFRGETDIRVGLEYQRLATLYQSLGLNDCADTAMQQACYAARNDRDDVGKFDMAVFLHNQAWLEAQRGAWKDSERDYKTCLKLIKRTIGSDNILTALTANNLAEVLSLQGKYKECEHWYKKTLALLKLSGADGSTIQTVINDYLKVMAAEHKRPGIMQAYSRMLLR